jgi:hypothetical protein
MCREFYLFNVMDACVDGGGAYDPETHSCDGSRFGNWDVGARAGVQFWVVLLGGPAITVLLLDYAISYLTSRVGVSPPNTTLHTDARATAVDSQPPSARAGERER